MNENQIVSATRTRQIAGISALAVFTVIIGSALAALLFAGAGSIGEVGFSKIYPIALFTVWQAFLSTIISIAFALPVARAFMTFHRFPGRRLLIVLFTLPLSLPVIVAVLGIVTLMGRNGIISQLFQKLGYDFIPEKT